MAWSDCCLCLSYIRFVEPEKYDLLYTWIQINIRFRNSSMYHMRVCNFTKCSPCHFDLSVQFLMFLSRWRQMNSASLELLFETRQSKFISCISWNSFWIPPYIFVYFSRSRLEHIQTTDHFFCCDFLHTIKFFNCRLGINN